MNKFEIRLKPKRKKKILHFGFLFCVLTPRKTTLPGVCSPVEAGEVARKACRRGGDLPRGVAYCYSAINANAFETIVLAIRDLN